MRKIWLLVVLAVAPLAADTKVIAVKHRSAQALRRLLANMPTDFSPELNAITLLGTAEQNKVAEAIIAQFDTPRRQAEFLIRVIEATSSPQAPNDAADLVPAELKSLVKYQRYGLLDSAVVRGMEAERPHIALGGNMDGHLRFDVRESALELALSITGPPSVVMDKGTQTTSRYNVLDTTATMKSGETVVLGASKMRGGNNALIVLVTAKLLP